MAIPRKCIDNRHTYNYISYMGFFWNEDKNLLLKKERSVSFERIVVAIEEGHLVDVLEHSNKAKYGDHVILIVDISGYAFCVPCVVRHDGSFFLKTLCPSRKYTKAYNLGGES